MIQSFDVPVDQAAKYTGWLSASFSLAQCLTAIAWGRASDRLGRKPMILLALTIVMCGSIAFGFSTSLAMAFLMRSIQGMASGNVGIIRTTVAEMVPERELQPRAFSIMPLVWNVGSIFGPTLGGSLVHPTERYGGIFKKFTIFERFPFALPNLIISFLFLIGILSGFFFLQETHGEKKDRRDYGVILGQSLTRSCRGRATKKPLHNHSDSNGHSDDEEAQPFLVESGRELTNPVAFKKKQKPTVSKRRAEAGWKDVFSPQSKVNLIAYTGLAMHSVAFDQILPVFFNYPTNDQVEPPFKFSGGFGLKSPRIGLLFTIYGFFGMIVQFLVFPPAAKKYGILNCFKVCALTFPIVYAITPFTSLIRTDNGRQMTCLFLMLIKCVAGIFAFPCSTILLTNSAASLKILGTLNGVATSISAVGRAAGPALAGATFTIGVDAGYVILPFWTLALIAVIAAVPIWWLVEMEFDVEDEDGDDEEEEVDEANVALIDDNDDDHDDSNGNDDENDRTKQRKILQVKTDSDNAAESTGTDVIDLMTNDGNVHRDGMNVSNHSRHDNLGGDGQISHKRSHID